VELALRNAFAYRDPRGQEFHEKAGQVRANLKKWANERRSSDAHVYATECHRVVRGCNGPR
jgi:hypothetical protein